MVRGARYLQVSTAGPRQVALAWHASAETGDQPLDGYEVSPQHPRTGALIKGVTGFVNRL